MTYQKDCFGFVYIWFDRAKKRYCIGSHYGTTDDGYTSSTGHFERSYKKRPSHFMRRILYWLPVPDLKLLHQEEQRWLDRIPDEELGHKYYNFKKLARGGNGRKTYKKHSPEVKEACSRRSKNARWVHNPNTGKEHFIQLPKVESFLTRGFLPGRLPSTFGKISKKRRSYIGEGNPLFGKKRQDLANYNRLPKRWINDGEKSFLVLTSELHLHSHCELGRLPLKNS